MSDAKNGRASVRTIENPVTGERATFVETSAESGGARSVLDFDVAARGGVPTHRHATHEERIEVLDGAIEVTSAGKKRRYGAGEVVVLAPGEVHSWRNPATDRTLRFRVTMTPGYPGFEGSLRLFFGLGRDGEARRNGVPRRLSDLALLVELDPSSLAGPLSLLAPLMRWSARRAHASGRAAELFGRYGIAAPARA
jgi:quercetin dioxygenase-like cupin family protein